MFRGDSLDAEAAAPLHAALDLVYTTDASCRAVMELPSSSDALATRLLPADAAFRGNMQLSKAASGDGCALYLTVKGAVSPAATDFHDAFDVARGVHQQLTELLSSKGLENVALARATVALDGDKLLSVSLQDEGFDTARESVLTVQQGTCTELLAALRNAEDVENLLPRQVQTNALDVTKQTGADEAADCAVDLEVAGIVPRLSADAEAFQLLKAVDEKTETFFAGQASATLSSANVRLQVASAEENVKQTLTVETASVSSTPSSSATFNPPSYEEALGIFALVAVLVAMMMGVVVQKKRNDRRSRERYERANRAAQIRRVSIRMSQYDREEDLDNENEKDSLL
ncbi:hypothetical protein PF005_g18536 [Phytophthora fragariae]|uniref:Uncharacterized protein n=2 Tax=Phytophthora TaxID=4783 RepID=A0A6A3XRL3_9STRA|nr:hypothetical protein PF003_g5793 [Phytophthora fragariae]KAE8989062.1 hypothetical protein PR002_g21563 [Phytophthora rubi]KAE8931085.1 hypothetical protein PF009_g18842 [Phytophthora fragariae]KAE8992328.1 hypothetical protein PR001_g20974 [Phytophthora rubi]KAE8992761.1 hypothetical protein PF011_g17428 [Phytophthora fragariae]